MTETCLLNLMKRALQDEYTEYLKLSKLSEEQLNLLQVDDVEIDAIADVMQKRVDIIHVISSLEVDHEDTKLKWEKHYLDFSESEREPIAHLREEMLDLIQSLKECEDQIAKKIRRHENEISKKLGELNRGRQASQAYFSTDQRTPRFIDKTK